MTMPQPDSRMMLSEFEKSQAEVIRERGKRRRYVSDDEAEIDPSILAAARGIGQFVPPATTGQLAMRIGRHLNEKLRAWLHAQSDDCFLACAVELMIGLVDDLRVIDDELRGKQTDRLSSTCRHEIAGAVKNRFVTLAAHGKECILMNLSGLCVATLATMKPNSTNAARRVLIQFAREIIRRQVYATVGYGLSAIEHDVNRFRVKHVQKAEALASVITQAIFTWDGCECPGFGRSRVPGRMTPQQKLALRKCTASHSLDAYVEQWSFGEMARPDLVHYLQHAILGGRTKLFKPPLKEGGPPIADLQGIRQGMLFHFSRELFSETPLVERMVAFGTQSLPPHGLLVKPVRRIIVERDPEFLRVTCRVCKKKGCKQAVVLLSDNAALFPEMDMEGTPRIQLCPAANCGGPISKSLSSLWISIPDIRLVRERFERNIGRRQEPQGEFDDATEEEWNDDED